MRNEWTLADLSESPSDKEAFVYLNADYAGFALIMAAADALAGKPEMAAELDLTEVGDGIRMLCLFEKADGPFGQPSARQLQAHASKVVDKAVVYNKDGLIQLYARWELPTVDGIWELVPDTGLPGN